MTSEIEMLENVDQVISITNVPDNSWHCDGFEVRELIEEFPTTESEIDSLKKRIMGIEMIYGTLASADFQKAGIIAYLKVPLMKIVTSRFIRFSTLLKINYAGPEQISHCRIAFDSSGGIGDDAADVKKLFPYGIILMIFLLVLTFHSWTGAFLPFTVVIMSIVFTVGLMVLFNIKMTIVEMMIPVMLIAIANSYSIQVITQYFVEYLKNPDAEKDSLIRLILSYLTTPVLLSGFTTLVGFLCLLSHVLPPAKNLGILCACGTTIAFIYSLTFIPAALKLLGFPVTLKTAGSRKRTSRFLQSWGQFFTRYHKPFLGLSLVAIIIVATGIRRIIVDTNPIAYWKKSSEIRQSNEVIDRNFGGSSTISVLATGDIKDPQFLKKIENLCTFLEKSADCYLRQFDCRYA